MRYSILGVCLLVLTNGCRPVHKAADPSCKEYFGFIQATWKFDEAKSIFYFEGYPEFWDKEKHGSRKFVNNECLRGMSKGEIVKLFGEPSKVQMFENATEILTYCMNENCLTEYLKTIEVVIILDEKKNASIAFHRPTEVRRN